MNRYVYIFLFLCLFTLAGFVLFEAAGLSFEGMLRNGASKVALAVTGVLLLGIDVLLPVPSSVVMIGNGVLFGVVAGGLLSVLGGLISSGLGYYLGARSERLVAKFTGSGDQARARAFLEKYGYAAIVASRPIPVLAEAVAIISGSLGLRLGRVLVSSVIGLVPVAFVYSFTGAYSTGLDSAEWAFALNLGVAGLLWLVTRRGK
ncbi:MAG: VTT domain-containing protein [Cytophagales bacterium]|nr:VTT domain-containing protein [Cytophagales bacterium]